MTEAQLRVDFEAWMNQLPVKPDLRMNGLLYRNLAIQSRWVGWKGAYARYN